VVEGDADPAEAEIDSDAKRVAVLTAEVGEGVMVACVDPTVRVKVRDKLRVAMRPSRLHVFDAKTGGRIGD